MYDLQMTHAQVRSMRKLYVRRHHSMELPACRTCRKSKIIPYKQHMGEAHKAFGDVVMINLWGMWLGIETDGHCHS